MLKTITPIDNTIYVERDYASAEEIEKTLSISKNAFHDWSQTSLNDRKKIVSLFPTNTKKQFFACIAEKK